MKNFDHRVNEEEDGSSKYEELEGDNLKDSEGGK